MQEKPRGKHFKFSAVSGQVVGALYILPWESIVGHHTAETWGPWFSSDIVQGGIFAVVSWAIYELYEVFK